MRRVEVRLREGIRIGDIHYDRARVREQSVGDLLDAEESSRNETERGIEMMARQIEYLSSADGQKFDGPLARAVMRKFTIRDMRVLGEAIEKLQEDDTRGGE